MSSGTRDVFLQAAPVKSRALPPGTIADPWSRSRSLQLLRQREPPKPLASPAVPPLAAASGKPPAEAPAVPAPAVAGRGEPPTKAAPKRAVVVAPSDPAGIITKAKAMPAPAAAPPPSAPPAAAAPPPPAPPPAAAPASPPAPAIEMYGIDYIGLAVQAKANGHEVRCTWTPKGSNRAKVFQGTFDRHSQWYHRPPEWCFNNPEVHVTLPPRTKRRLRIEAREQVAMQLRVNIMTAVDICGTSLTPMVNMCRSSYSKRARTLNRLVILPRSQGVWNIMQGAYGL